MTDRGSEPPLTPRARLRWSVIEPMVARLAPRSVLELGCGLGGVGTRLAGMVDSYTAVEPDAQSFEVASARITPRGGRVLHGDHNKVPEGSRYDLVCAFEVLEHIADDAATLADWVPFVRPGGHLLLSVPADPDKFGPSDMLAGHYRRYTPEQLAARLAEAGLTEVRLRHYGWILGSLLDSGRNWISRDKVEAAAETPEERSHTSGRLFQPQSPVVAGVIRVAVAPFALLQDLRPNTGPGLVVTARRPGDA